MKMHGRNIRIEEINPKANKGYINVALISPDVLDIKLWADRLSCSQRIAIQYFNALEQLQVALPQLKPDVIIVDDYLPGKNPLAKDLRKSMEVILEKVPLTMCYYYGIDYYRLSSLTDINFNLFAAVYDQRQLDLLRESVLFRGTSFI